jgi:hypothetical protein
MTATINPNANCLTRARLSARAVRRTRFANPSIDGVLPMMMMMMMPVPVMMIPPVVVMIPPVMMMMVVVVVMVILMMLKLSGSHLVFVTGSIGERTLILGS